MRSQVAQKQPERRSPEPYVVPSRQFMPRRLPTAILLAAGLLSVVAHAGEPLRAPHGSLTLSGGFSIRNTTYLAETSEGGQAQTTKITGVSPWLVRLRADWFPLTWLGVEAEGSGDFFRALKGKVPLDQFSVGGAGRLGVSLRYLSTSGFVLNGSFGYAFAVSPYIRIATVGGVPSTAFVFSNGPAARIGLGFAGARFQAIGGATAMLGLDRKVTQIEPQLWLAGKVAEAGPAAFWVGLDAGALFEGSAKSYSGTTLRFSLALKLELLPPAPAPKPLVGPQESATTLQLQVQLADGAPAVGALVALDGAAPAPVNEKGQLTLDTKPGEHTVTAQLAGHRPGKVTAQALEGKQTPVLLALAALTGPGQLSGIVRASATALPVPDATVTVGDAPPVQTGADGTYKFENVGPGPVKVRVDAQGFGSADELAQVPPESAATLDIQLEPLGKGSPATVRGLVRSRTGEPLKASVVIKGLATKIDVTPEGRFFVTVPGGTYQFIISAPGYLTQMKKVVLADGDQAIVHTELQKASK